MYLDLNKKSLALGQKCGHVVFRSWHINLPSIEKTSVDQYWSKVCGVVFEILRFVLFVQCVTATSAVA